ncbi:dynamin family protein [Verrucomicrobia bacterium]|nr:dynamin family protein [Verrucomicrobiota bacterium]
MKTEISDFCKEYSSALIPAGAALDAVIEQIESDSQEGVLRLNLAGLNEVKHRLKSLIDKVEGQQAYLLIFGPLKSGKSTLMNAISGAYVSEVTSLPAYPCLVYVRHGEKPTIKLTRYNGRETETEDKNVMEVLINDSHSNLADRIRTVEEAGREFDPGLDYPEAIRRIDIDLTAHELNDSGTVLVDTPGLYSRMKFGYDLMTREFRNSAACAVFVVKTDNLFLEQVFEEFNDLLGLFSRVFLVVNIDSSKRDLRPDGSLQPSLESENPQKIIDAFQLLSMSAALRTASKDGRLKIYPIDLLNAASQHLLAANGSDPQVDAIAKAVLDTATSEGETTEIADNSDEQSDPAATLPEGLKARAGRPDDFQAFLSELTEYLNSSDYLFELMSDSFRQGDSLREEMVRNCEADSIQEFVTQQRRLRNEVEEINEQLIATRTLADFNWDKAFEGTHADLEQEATRFAKEVKEDLQKSLQSGIENWFETPECLGDLVDKTWQGRIEALQKQISEKMAASVKNVVDSSSGGARPTPEMVISLDRVRLSLRDVYNSSIKALSGLPKVAECSIELDLNDIPVNRTFWDRILFQSQAKVRRRLLGASGELKNEVPPGKKRKRLLPGGKAALESIVEEQLKGILPGVPNRCSRDYLKLYVEQFKMNFSSQMKIRQAELDKSKQKLERRIEANDRISGAFETLDTAISGLEGEMDGLKNKFLRSARLARGFQIIDTSISAFSLWTAPYCGGVAIVPSSHSKLEVPEEEPEIDSNEGDDSESWTGFGAFTVWTAEHIGIELNDSSSCVQTEGSDDEEESEEADASVVVSLPTATEEPSEAAESEPAAADEEAVESSDESVAEEGAGDSAEAQEAESADPAPTPVRVVPNPTDQQS